MQRVVRERMRGALAGVRAVLLAGVLWGAGAARAGEVLVLRGAESAPYKALESAFMQSMGQEARALPAHGPDTRATVKAALGQSPALVLSIGTEPARALAELRAPVPTVLTLLLSPERLGLDARVPAVPMYASPRRLLQLARAAMPELRRVGLPYDPAQSQALVERCREAAAATGLTLVTAPVKAKSEVAGAVRGLVDKQVDAVWLIPDTTVVDADTFKFMVQLSLQRKVPLVGFSEGLTRAGALLSLEADAEEMGRQAAAVARRVLAGKDAQPEPTEGVLSLNARTAEAMGLPLPNDVRRKAAKVFE